MTTPARNPFADITDEVLRKPAGKAGNAGRNITIGFFRNLKAAAGLGERWTIPELAVAAKITPASARWTVESAMDKNLIKAVGRRPSRRHWSVEYSATPKLAKVLASAKF